MLVDPTMADGPSSGRVPPNDQNAERAVLGGILLANEALNTVTEMPLRAIDFDKDAHALIYEAMLELFAGGQPVDTVTLREHLSTSGKLPRVGGDEYLLGLTDTIPTVSNIEAHARIVRRSPSCRRVITPATRRRPRATATTARSDAVPRPGRAAVFDVAKERLRSPSTSHINDRRAAHVRGNHRGWPNASKHITGLPTGLSPPRLVHGRLSSRRSGDRAGRPGMGKTAFAMNIGVNACRARRCAVVVFSLEMPRDQLVTSLCSEARRRRATACVAAGSRATTGRRSTRRRAS